MKRLTNLIAYALIACGGIATTVTNAQAATIVNSDELSLLRPNQANFLELLAGALGKGDLTLTSIFDSRDFLVDGKPVLAPLGSEVAAAVDGMGPTFTIMRAISLNGVNQRIGWYNPINGTTATGGSDGETASDAFIFNLDAGRVLRTYDVGDETVSSAGAGLGIYLENDRTYASLSRYDYRDEYNTNVFWNPAMPNYEPGTVRFTQIEVFSISVNALAQAVAVPEPATWATMLVGFGMIGAAARYRRRRQKATCA